MTRYRQEFIVEGGGTFPYDMLRYDRCYPAEENQSCLLQTVSHDRQVRLARETYNKNDMPTIARWASFGWRVLEHTIEIRRY